MDEYADSHRNKANIAIHKICVPAIVLSLLGLLKSIPGPVDFSYMLIALSLGYYAQFKDLRAFGAGLLMAAPTIIILEILKPYLFLPSLIVFILAWAGQFWGHKMEGKKPSFFRDIVFLLIGPLWVLQSFFEKNRG